MSEVVNKWTMVAGRRRHKDLTNVTVEEVMTDPKLAFDVLQELKEVRIALEVLGMKLDYRKQAIFTLWAKLGYPQSQMVWRATI